MATGISGYMFDGATAVGEGEAIVVKDSRYIIIYFTAENVTDGAIINLESLAPDDTWHTIVQQRVTSGNPVPPVMLEGAFNQLRANIIVYNDGEYTITFNTKV